MNFRSFTSRTLAAAALATLAFASAPASACYGYQCNNNPPPAPTPTPTNFTFQIGTGVAFQGEGFGSWAGNDGGVDIVKEGFGLTESSFTLGGDMCGGIDCAAGQRATHERTSPGRSLSDLWLVRATSVPIFGLGAFFMPKLQMGVG